jgi:hypothetical protein
MTILVLLTIAILLVFAAAVVFAPSREIVTHVDIDATPSQVWSILTDAASYPEWNPFLVSMEGELSEGKVLTNRMKTATGSEISFRPTVLKVAKDRELRWLGQFLLPRIFDGEHYFKLEARGGHTRLVHGERFSGVLLWFMDVDRFKANFEALNQALKSRAESRGAALR